MSEITPGVDIYDDDYWLRFEGIMERRQPYFAAMRRLAKLSRSLTELADEEYRERQAAEPADLRERREARSRRLRDSALRAIGATDPAEAERLWGDVDRMLRSADESGN